MAGNSLRLFILVFKKLGAGGGDPVSENYLKSFLQRSLFHLWVWLIGGESDGVSWKKIMAHGELTFLFYVFP